MVIESDEYKYDACSITNDECCGGSCCSCEVTIKEDREYKQSETEADRKRYTTFEQQYNIQGVTVMVEPGKVIAKTDMETLKALQENTILFSTNTIQYHPDNLKQYAPNLRKLRKYNNLRIPDMIWGAKNYPAAFLFGDVVYLIAPRIEDVV